MLRQHVGPAFGASIGEIAVDAANACLPDLGNLLEQSVCDLCGSIVGIDQNGETGRAEFRRHDFPQIVESEGTVHQAAPIDGSGIDIPMSGRLPPDLICSSPAKQQMPRSPHALANGASEIVPLFRLKRCEQGVGQDFRYALVAVYLLQQEGFRSRYRGDNVPLRRRARQDQRVDVTGKFNARSNVRDIRQIIICIETRKEACALGLPDEKIVPCRSAR